MEHHNENVTLISLVANFIVSFIASVLAITLVLSMYKPPMPQMLPPIPQQHIRNIQPPMEKTGIPNTPVVHRQFEKNFENQVKPTKMNHKGQNKNRPNPAMMPAGPMMPGTSGMPEGPRH